MSEAGGPERGQDAPERRVETTDVVLRFLQSVGRPSEARFYLDLFRSSPPEQFAIVAVDPNVLRSASEAVVLDLRFLSALGLTPTVVLGLLQPANARAQARTLATRLAEAGVACDLVPLSSEDVEARITESTRADRVPIAWFEPADGEDTPARFDRLARLLGALVVHKLIFLHRPGGLRSRGALVPLVDLGRDVDALLEARDLSRKETEILQQSRRLVLERVPHRLLVAVTSPLDLLGELFTVRGTGTLLRRGASIIRHEGWEGVDMSRLRALLVASFGREPRPEFFEGLPSAVYREESWRGAAVLRDLPLGAYLSKFAVSPEAQGEGIARDLWDAIAEQHPAIFWRARPDNAIAEWYGKLADGLVRTREWVVFWKGVAIPDVPNVVLSALEQPVDMPRG